LTASSAAPSPASVSCHSREKGSGQVAALDSQCYPDDIELSVQDGQSQHDTCDASYREEGMSEIHRITANPDQCGGRPCLRGLRIRVKDVLDLLASGASREEILEDYPLLEAEDITAALEYAALQSDHPVLRVA